jgi:hypothetical protein
MAKFSIAVTAGVANVYPFGQQHDGHVMKAGQSIDLEVGPDCEPKMADVAGVLGLMFDKMKEDLGAPAAGVATSEPITKREGTLDVTAVDGDVLLRRYAGSDFAELILKQGEHAVVDVTESNRITLAVYDIDDPKADHK